MQATQQGRRYIVVDDFLSPSGFAAAQDLMEGAAFTLRESVISSEDGPAFRSRGARFRHDLGTPDAPRQAEVYEELARTVRTFAHFFGEAGADWDRISFAFWKYPAGSRLGWHNDAGLGRQGEFILFLHDRWRPSWGGELKLVDEDPLPATEAEDAVKDLVLRMEARIERSRTSPVAIVPKPNRLVMVKADTVHTIGRVDPTAGDALRRTLTGFVAKSPARQRTRESALESLSALLTTN
ncbi:2OG-Fe(II) oxygenase [Streptomyces longwoodensis]|uniref:2OG-Fe(II) oxygenase n=1 Tax=Streptomyces longwoodensis TaxID=68231 RepID=UPI00225AC220|nr:2OG-Fe(II) oxygenase [Streptomyces longwoodensis]MCX5000779.1 2OG-Fe(II) oxygenase [Streptomyces longwoodensis]